MEEMSQVGSRLLASDRNLLVDIYQVGRVSTEVNLALLPILVT